VTNPTPAAAGYRWPAEWEPHAATWIAWPHRRADWPGKLDAVTWTYTEIVRHLALSVDSKETLAAWQERLAHHGVHVTGPVNHDDTWLSIYFGDPNGVTLELTHQSRALDDEDARRAASVVADWAAKQ